MPPDSDGELMQRLQAGDDRALDGLMDRWQVPLRRFLQRSTHDEQDALDLAQEAFVRVYLNRRSFRAGAKFSTWLFAIAVNLSRDRARRRRARPVVALDPPALATASDRAAAAASDAPAERLERRETSAAVRAAVDALPEPLRTTVLLCEFERLPQADAAAVLHCSPKAIETRLYRARSILRAALARYL